MHRRAVADGVVDGRLAQGMDADAATAQAGGVDAGGLAVGKGPGLSVLVERAGGAARFAWSAIPRLNPADAPTPDAAIASDTVGGSARAGWDGLLRSG
jgi:hypothetical protein